MVDAIAGSEYCPREGGSPTDSGPRPGEAVLQTASDSRESTEENRATSSGDAFDGETEGALELESAPAISEVARPLEGKETNAFLKTGESIVARSQKAVEDAAASLAEIEEGLSEDAATMAARAMAARDAAPSRKDGYRPRHFVFDGCPAGGVGVADFWGSIGGATQKAREYIVEEAKRDPAWAGATAREISDNEAKVIEDAIAEKELEELDAETNSEGESPAERGEPTSDERKPDAPAEVAAPAAEAPSEVSTSSIPETADQPIDSRLMEGKEVVSPEAANEGKSLGTHAPAAEDLKKVGPSAGLAPDREVSGSAEADGVAPPVSAPDLGLSRWGCRKEGEPFHRFATPLQKWSDCKDIDRAEALTWTPNPNPLCERCAASADAAVASAAAAPSLPAIVKPPVASETTAGPDGKGLCAKCTKATKRKLPSSIDATDPNREQLEPLAGKYLCVDCRAEIEKKKCAGKKGDGSPCTTKPKTGSAYCGRHQSQTPKADVLAAEGEAAHV